MRLLLESTQHIAWDIMGAQWTAARDPILLIGDEAAVKCPEAGQPIPGAASLWHQEGRHQSSLEVPGSLCRDGHPRRYACLLGNCQQIVQLTLLEPEFMGGAGDILTGSSQAPNPTGSWSAADGECEPSSSCRWVARKAAVCT